MEQRFDHLGCCSSPSASCKGCLESDVTRRGFLARSSGLGALALASPPPLPASLTKDPARIQPVRLPLRVQPVFVYTRHERKEATSWRWTAEIYDEKLAAEEMTRIGRDLEAIKAQADFPIEILPVISVRDKAQAAAMPAGNHDAVIIYAAARNPDVLEVVARPDKWNLMFVRHRSGPMYYMYVGVHGHFFRKGRDQITQKVMDVDDVVVDSRADLLWRLRALSGLRNTIGKRIVTIGSPGGWGEEGALAPGRARDRWKLDIQAVTYEDLGKRIQRANQDEALLRRLRQAAADYASQKGVRLETSREFLEKSFVLTEIFRDYLDEFKTDAITIKNCMSTVMPISGTTACMPLSILNDEGYLAFCESDFVCIPAGILLHYVSGKPVFMANPSFPYNSEVTVSHCTGPRRMDGITCEPVRIVTHYESDFGAAPKVEMRKGQQLTILDPDFEAKGFLGLGGEISGTPFYPMCRTQLEIGFQGSGARLRQEVRGWHWMLCYGHYLKEAGYAVRKAGIEWLEI
jgi:hypothetical protein